MALFCSCKEPEPCFPECAICGKEIPGSDSDIESKPCYYCNEDTEPLAANPGRWPLYFSHSDEPGVVKAHHTDCVQDKLRALEFLAECQKEAAETMGCGCGSADHLYNFIRGRRIALGEA